MGAYEYWADDGSLPVGLSAFTALMENNAIVLSWIVESEVNNLGFILDRYDENAWVCIASYETHEALQGRGNASSAATYTYTDPTALPGTEVSYRLSDMSFDGHLNHLDIITLSTTMDAPDASTLEPASPNPFNPRTKITYRLAEQSALTLTVYDMIGRKVRTLLSRQIRPAGSYTMYWDGRNDRAELLGSGMFFVLMQTDTFRKVQKVTLIR